MRKRTSLPLTVTQLKTMSNRDRYWSSGEIAAMNAPVLTFRLTPEVTTSFAELDLVLTLRDVTTDEGGSVPAGTRGTVVVVYADGTAFEVEFECGLATVRAADLVAA